MENETKMKHFKCANAQIVKFKNSKVQVISSTEGYTVELIRLCEDTSPKAAHTVKRNKVVITGIKLSVEGAIALMIAFQEQLLKDAITIKKETFKNYQIDTNHG